MSDAPVITEMKSLIEHWQSVNDQRAVFLSCYMLMTQNMITAIRVGEFHDPDWVDHLLVRFADYYFDALHAYEQDPTRAPAVWRAAHAASNRQGVLALQKLLLGVNAHINYDLVLTLVDLLETDWAHLTDTQRQARYADYTQVNEIISSTIDAVQDQILEPEIPAMRLIDTLMGALDERIIARLLTDWRELVWRNAARLMETSDPAERAGLIAGVEQAALRRVEAINLKDLRGAMGELF